MTVQFGRVVELDAGNRDIGFGYLNSIEVRDLRVSFRVSKDLEKTPNSAEVNVFNLSPDSRAEAESRVNYIYLRAGYQNGVEEVFQGDVRTVLSRKEQTAWRTTFTCGDGDVAIESSRVSKSLKPGATVNQIIGEVGRAFNGVDVTDVLKRLEAKDPRERKSLLKQILSANGGFVASGKVEKEFSKLARGLGKKWSIQNGKLEVLGPTETSSDRAIYLSPTTGLIGAPFAGDDGYVHVKAYIQPGFVPGRRIALYSEAYQSGEYRIERVTLDGDNRGSAWYADMEMKAL